LPTDDLRPIWLVLAGHIESASTIHAIIKHSVTTMVLFEAYAAVNFVASLARFSSEVVFHERNDIPHARSDPKLLPLFADSHSALSENAKR